jgi:hypothetical protein
VQTLFPTLPAGSDTFGSLQVAADNNLASLELDFDGDGTVDSTVSPGIAFDPQQSMSVFKDFIRTLGFVLGQDRCSYCVRVADEVAVRRRTENRLSLQFHARSQTGELHGRS